MILELEDGAAGSEIHSLPSPGALAALHPRGECASRQVLATRRAIRDVLHGRDAERLLVVVGPCSIHDRTSALAYAQRLAHAADRWGDALLIVMRTYFEKPRTTIGWKGLIHDPHLDDSADVATGLRSARSLLCEINELGLPCASEILDPLVSRYIGDLLSWVAIGARTSESQPHRELASGLPIPVGFKNPTSGDVRPAANALIAARKPHSAFGIDADGSAALVRTRGNLDGHLVLRGGAAGPNYFPEHVAYAAKLGREAGLARPVMVDCSHDNSGQDHRVQAAVCRAVLAAFRGPGDPLMGLLLESHLRPGSQPWSPGDELAYGVSITDACIGWEETEALLAGMASAARAGARRSKAQRPAGKMARA